MMEEKNDESDDERRKLFYSFHDMKPSILEFQKDFSSNTLLFGSDKFEETINRKNITVNSFIS